jgi:hypothetical protein
VASDGERGCGQERDHGGEQLPRERPPVRLDQLDDRLVVTQAEPRPSVRCVHAWLGGRGRRGDRSGPGRVDRRRLRNRRDRRLGGHGTRHEPRLGSRNAGLRAGSRRRRRKLEHRPGLRRADRHDDPKRRHRRRGRGSRDRGRWESRRRRLARLRRRSRERRQEAQWVEIPLRVAADPDSELHVRDRVGRHAARADDPDRLALRHNRAPADQERAEVQERDGVAVGRLNGDREPVRRDLADERHRSGGRRDHRVTERPLDVDPTMLAREERVLLVKREALQHRPGKRPRPRAGRGGHRERQEHRNDRDPGENRSLLPVLQTELTVPGRPDVVKFDYSERR